MMIAFVAMIIVTIVVTDTIVDIGYHCYRISVVILVSSNLTSSLICPPPCYYQL